MLYKNEVIYPLLQKEIEAIEKFFHGKFPVKIVYPPERIVPSRLKHNRKPDKPTSMSFDLRAVVKTPNGAETWRYAENVLTDGMGKKKYMPKKFRFDGARHLTRNDIELIYFLLRKSEYCQGGDNQGRMVKFMFEDLVTEAEKKAASKKIEAKISGLLFGEDFGLPEEKLRLIAKAYFINNIDKMALAQVKNALDNKIHETKDGPDKFFDMVNAEDEIKTRVSIQKAMDMGLLKYDQMKKIWYWQVAGEKGITTICKVPPNKTASDALYDYYLGDESFRDDVQAVLLTKNPKAGTQKADEGDEKPE
jgi:hypothetical protein